MTWFFQKVDTLKEFRQFAFSYLLQKAFKVVNFGSLFLFFFFFFFFFFFWETAELITAFQWHNYYFLDDLKPYQLGTLLARASLNDIDDDQISCGSWNSISYLPTFLLLTLVEKWIPFAVRVLENEVKMLKWWLYQSRIGFLKSKNW